MKRLISMALALTVVAAPAAAVAGPVEGNLGVLYKPIGKDYYGVEGEIGPAGSGWSVGGLYQVSRHFTEPDGPSTWTIPTHATVWGRMLFDLPNGDRYGGLVGVNYYPESAYLGQTPPDAWRYVGPVFGLTYLLRSGRIWLRATPHIVISPDKQYQEMSWLTKSGIPWAEAGVEVLPGLDLSFRLSTTVVKLAWRFD